jgi:hypothetical protein
MSEDMAFEMGEWVQCWGQVVETDPHPEEITVRMESHNEDYRCLVRRDRVVRVDETPAFAPKCGSLASSGGGTYRRCERAHGHGGDHRHSSVSWANGEALGWMEDYS